MLTLLKEIKSTIKINFKRFASIIIIIFLGVSFYVGMRNNASVLQDSMTTYYDKYNYSDVKLFSEIGLTEQELKLIKRLVPSIEKIEGKYYGEAITQLDNGNGEKSDYAVYLHSYNKNNKINKIKITKGRNIKSSDECVVNFEMEERGVKIGDTITLDSSNLKRKEFKIVGFSRDPQYIVRHKGPSTLLGGMVSHYAYISDDVFDIQNDVYVVADIKLRPKYKNFTEEYKKYLAKQKIEIEKVAGTILDERGKIIINQQAAKLEEGEKQYNAKKAEVEAQLQSAKSQIDDAQAQLDQAKIGLLPESKIDEYFGSLKKQIEASKSSIDAMERSVQISDKVIDVLERIDEGTKVYDDDGNLIGREENVESMLVGTVGVYIKDEYKKLANEVSKLYAPLDNINNEILAFNCDDLTIDGVTVGPSTTGICINAYNGLKDRVKTENEIVHTFVDYTNELDSDISNATSIGDTVVVFKKYKSRLEVLVVRARAEYDGALNEYNRLYAETKGKAADARTIIAQKQQEIDNARAEYDKREKEALEGLEKAYNEIIEGKKLLQRSYTFTHTAYTRNDNYGYGSYYDDTIRIDNLAKLFPLMFFVVASLVTATSITRLIQEERGKIGIYKSLGFNRKQIIFKYFIYSLSADIIGVVFGSIVGIFFFPMVISKAYGLTYYMPETVFSFPTKTVLVAILLSLISTVLISLISALKVAREVPSKLMRKKEIKQTPFKVVEERIESINKLDVTKRIALRNIFSNPMRSLMTIIGVVGCCTLLIAGFCVRESIYKYIEIQFDKIYTIDTEFFYKGDISQYEISKDYEELSKLSNVKNVSLVRKDVITIDDYNTLQAYTIVPDTLETFEKNIGLYDYKDNKKINLRKENGVVITAKLAKLLNLKKGDKFTYTDSSNVRHEVKISNIAENYLFTYIYMNKDVYKETYDYDLMDNCAMIKYKNDKNIDDEDNKIFSRNNYALFDSTNFYKNENKRVVRAVDKIIFVIIISAGLLAVVVLYNISKINISEKVVEIATLKVLGYNSKWINKYINYEIAILKYVGIFIGLFGGYSLAEEVITSCEMDYMMFYHGFSIFNYIYGIILTVVFSKMINLIMRKEIKNISMSKSLKATEE